MSIDSQSLELNVNAGGQDKSEWNIWKENVTLLMRVLRMQSKFKLQHSTTAPLQQIILMIYTDQNFQCNT